MKNKLIKFIVIFCFYLTPFELQSSEQFNFDVTNIEILENGNLFKGTNKGIVTTNDGIQITADNFEYNKISNVLNASGNVILRDDIKNYIIF